MAVHLSSEIHSLRPFPSLPSLPVPFPSRYSFLTAFSPQAPPLLIFSPSGSSLLPLHYPQALLLLPPPSSLARSLPLPYLSSQSGTQAPSLPPPPPPAGKPPQLPSRVTHEASIFSASGNGQVYAAYSGTHTTAAPSSPPLPPTPTPAAAAVVVGW